MSTYDNDEELDSLNQTSDEDDTNVNEASEEVENDHEDDSNLEERLQQLKEQNARLFKRAKKAEGFKQLSDGSWVKEIAKKGTKQIINNKASTIDAEELRLIARGLSDDEINEAKAIARGKNISITEALQDNLFVAYKNALDEKQRKANAKLGASNGSGYAQIENKYKSGMSDAEFEQLWRERNGIS